MGGYGWIWVMMDGNEWCFVILVLDGWKYGVLAVWLCLCIEILSIYLFEFTFQKFNIALFCLSSCCLSGLSCLYIKTSKLQHRTTTFGYNFRRSSHCRGGRKLLRVMSLARCMVGLQRRVLSSSISLLSSSDSSNPHSPLPLRSAFSSVILKLLSASSHCHSPTHHHPSSPPFSLPKPRTFSTQPILGPHTTNLSSLSKSQKK